MQYEIGVLPLSRNADLSPKAKDLATSLRKHWNVDFDDAGAIGRRYRRQDEIGTPFCITIDFESLEDQAVTIRERDSMAQSRIAIDQVQSYLATKFSPDALECDFKSKSVRLAIPSNSPHSVPANSNLYSISAVRFE